MIYLIEYTSFRLLQDKLQELGKNYEIFDLTNDNIKDVLTDISYNSMFSEKRNILIKNASFFTSKGKDEGSSLTDFLENYQSDNLVIFTTSEKVDERKKLTKAIISKHKLLKLNPPKFQDLDTNLNDYVKKFNYKIDRDALNYVKTSANNNYDIILNELDKLMMLELEDKHITLDIALKVVSYTINDNDFKLIDAITDKDLDLSLKLLKDYKLNKGEPVKLVAILGKEYHRLHVVTNLINKGKYMKEICSLMSLQDWQVNKYKVKAYKYTLKELEDQILALSNLDYQIKVGLIDSFLGLELFIIKSCDN